MLVPRLRDDRRSFVSAVRQTVKILLLQLKRIGDLILTTPAIAALRERFPEAEVTIVVSSECADLLPAISGVDRILMARTDFTTVIDTKTGYCQHFAGAMALMLRLLGIPARVAAGFVPGHYQDDFWQVTDHDAHTWVEVWFRGYGWLPFDPTPGRGRLSGTYSSTSLGFNAAAVTVSIDIGVCAACSTAAR